MLGVGNTGVAAASSLALDVRVAVGAGVFAAGNATSPAQNQAPASQKVVPTYNAFEFVYRPDYGKVVLLWENAETGQEVNQVPSEYHLQQYAATQRAQRAQQMAKLEGGSSPRPSGGTTVGKATSGGTGFVALAPAVQPSGGAAVQAAPAPAPAPVDIKV